MVFFFLRLNLVNHWREFFEWNLVETLFLLYTVLIFLVVWEVAAFSIRHFKNRETFQTNRGFLRIFFKAALAVLPFVFFLFLLVQFSHPPDLLLDIPTGVSWICAAF